MMQSWADYLNGLKSGADIIPIHKTSVWHSKHKLFLTVNALQAVHAL